MKRLSKKKLQELGFVKESWGEWWNGSVFVEMYPGDKEMTVYVAARITTSTDYARVAVGVRTEKDLISLCKLIDG